MAKKWKHRQCGDKVKWKSASIAAKHIGIAERRNQGLRGNLHAYYCIYCGAWHIGHQRRG